jgi:hypothetical protein
MAEYQRLLFCVQGGFSMNTRRLFILFAVIFVVSSGLNTGIARGAAYTLSYGNFTGGTCDASGFFHLPRLTTIMRLTWSFRVQQR